MVQVLWSHHKNWDLYSLELRSLHSLFKNTSTFINCIRSLNFREQKITVCIHAWNRTLLQGFRISKSLKMINIFLKLFTGCLKNYPIMKLFIKYHLIPYSSSNFWFNFFSRFFKSIKAAPYQIWSYFLTRLVVKQPINITPDKTLIKPIVCRELK